MLPKASAKKQKSVKPRSRSQKNTPVDIIMSDSDTATEPSEPLPVTKHSHTVKPWPAPDAELEALSVSNSCLKWTIVHIDRAIAWCEENLDDWQKPFLDSTQAAKDQSHKKLVLKTPKAYYHEKIAFHVFSVDEVDAVLKDFKKNRACYTKSVDNLFTQYS